MAPCLLPIGAASLAPVPEVATSSRPPEREAHSGLPTRLCTCIAGFSACRRQRAALKATPRAASSVALRIRSAALRLPALATNVQRASTPGRRSTEARKPRPVVLVIVRLERRAARRVRQMVPHGVEVLVDELDDGRLRKTAGHLGGDVVAIRLDRVAHLVLIEGVERLRDHVDDLGPHRLVLV